MTYRPLINIDITLQDASVSSIGFGTPLFASAHRYFPERVRSYTSLAAVAEDLPTDSNAYKAALGYFSLTPSPSIVKIGRREADLELSVATGATKASLTFSASDAGVTYTLPISISGEANATAVASAIATAIEGDADIGGLVVASATDETVSIDVATTSAEFWVSTLSSELSEEYNTTEDASALIAALVDEDNDFYFFSCEDHSDTFVQEASADIEARLKMYFTSTQDVNALTPYDAGSSTDLGGIIRDSGRNRTKMFFHHNADTIFAECYHVAVNAAYAAGSVVWMNVDIPVGISQNPSTGKALSTTMKTYLEDRNISYTERSVTAGASSDSANLRNNLVPSGEWISTIRGRDSMQVDLEAEMLQLVLSQKGSKIPYTQEGAAMIKASIANVLDLYVLRNFINDNYVITMVHTDDMPTSSKQQGLYDGASFKAELTQGILYVDVSGSLSVNL